MKTDTVKREMRTNPSSIRSEHKHGSNPNKLSNTCILIKTKDPFIVPTEEKKTLNFHNNQPSQTR